MPVGSYPPKGQLTGMAAVDCLLDNVINYAQNEEPIDIRPLHILLEQRKIMGDRILYVNGARSVDMDQQIKELELLINRVYIYNTRGNSADIDNVVRLCEQFKGKEMELL